MTLPEAVSTSASVRTHPTTRSVKAQDDAAAVKSSGILGTSLLVSDSTRADRRDAGRLSARVLSETSNEVPRIPDDFTAQGHYVSGGIKVKRTYNQVRSQHGVFVLDVKGKKGTLTCCVMTAVMLC